MDVWVKGSHSTKVEVVVRCLLKIKRDNPKAKVLVFSTWTDVLSVIASTLDENSVLYKSLYTAGKFQQNLSAFKQSDEGTTLLLPVHSGANGLNLIEATHVILVEPILNPAQELQAIGRVHCIGQTRPTKVHRFLIRGTIEQKMYVLIKSLDTHGLSKNSEDSVLTIGDLSALFSQQTEEDTELTENLQHTHVVSDQSSEHVSTGNNVLVEQNDHVSRSDDCPVLQMKI